MTNHCKTCDQKYVSDCSKGCYFTSKATITIVETKDTVIITKETNELHHIK